jgi:hypothetical protein
MSDKCALGLPLDRQRRDLARIGLEVSDKTLQSYWNYTIDLLEPESCTVSSDVFARSITERQLHRPIASPLSRLCLSPHLAT